MPKDTFYDAISEEPIKMLDEFVESAFEGIVSLFRDAFSSSSSSSHNSRSSHDDHQDSRSGGGCVCPGRCCCH